MAGTIDAIFTFGTVDPLAWIHANTTRRVAGAAHRTLHARTERHACILDAVFALRASIVAAVGATRTALPEGA